MESVNSGRQGPSDGVSVGIELTPKNLIVLFEQQAGRNKLHYLRRNVRGDWTICSVLDLNLGQAIIDNNFTHGFLRIGSLMPILY